MLVLSHTLSMMWQVSEVKVEVQKESKWGSRMRYAKIGAAAVGGGALLAVTGALS